MDTFLIRRTKYVEETIELAAESSEDAVKSASEAYADSSDWMLEHDGTAYEVNEVARGTPDDG